MSFLPLYSPPVFVNIIYMGFEIVSVLNPIAAKPLKTVRVVDKLPALNVAGRVSQGRIESEDKARETIYKTLMADVLR